MKRLQRGFVVETKFPRKAPREGANSIWGDTDLKAIARQVEDLVPQERPGTVPVKMPRILFPVEPSRHAGGSSAAEQTAAYITAAGPSVLPRSPVGNLTAEQPMDIRQTDANKQKKQLKKPRPPRRSVRTVSTQLPKQFDDFGQISMDWLDALETENKRLTAVLASLLEDENNRIKNAIDQFDTVGISSLLTR
ncbi:hypothetical protein [Rhizobium leguminosarum]|uniref:hypothetical protein n=1 Tax=Rhizobium leguminosarum TaxID=384 RepID=UPI003F993443